MTDTKNNDTFSEDANKERQVTIISNAISDEKIAMNQLLGRVQAVQAISSMLDAISLSQLQEIKNNKTYKALKGQTQTVNGVEYDLGAWEGFCYAIGSSRSKVDEGLQNLALLGESALKKVEALGMTTRELRKLRRLDMNEQQVIIGEIETNVGDKESIIELIEDMSVKHKKEKEALEKQIADEKAERQATDKVIGNKNKKIDELEKQLARKENASPFDRATEYAQEVAKLETAMLTTFGDIDRLFQCIGEDAELPTVLRVNQGQLLSQLKYHADTLINKYQLGDISVDDEQLDWVAEMQKEKAEGNVPEYITTGVA